MKSRPKAAWLLPPLFVSGLCSFSIAAIGAEPVSLPAGTKFLIQMDGPVNDVVLDVPHDPTLGVPIKAETVEDIFSGGRIFIPAHSTVMGHAQRLSNDRKAYTFYFDRLMVAGTKSLAISAVPSFKGGLIKLNRKGQVCHVGGQLAGITDDASHLSRGFGERIAVGLVRRSNLKSSSYDINDGDQFSLEAADDIRSDRLDIPKQSERNL